MELTEEQIQFLRGLDFLKMGQAVSHEQWQTAAMTAQRMERNIRQTGLLDMERNIMGLKQAIRCKNQVEAKQILSQLVAKRVQLLRNLEEKSKA
ncbi:MAG: hypothetical protein ACI4DO_08550 [Roseburia sp.]